MAAPTVESGGPALESWEAVDSLPEFQAAAAVAPPDRCGTLMPRLSAATEGPPVRGPTSRDA